MNFITLNYNNMFNGGQRPSPHNSQMVLGRYGVGVDITTVQGDKGGL